MRRLLSAGLALSALVAVVAVPAAPAKSGVRVSRSLLPLPASAIGPVAESLPLQRAGSGALQDGSGDATTPNRAFGFFGPVFGKVGWIGGYALDYGLGASGGTGVTEVRTSVDRFRTRRGAEKGLAFRKLNDGTATRWAGGGLTITDTSETLPRVGSRRFAFLVGYSDSNITPLFGLDEEFTEERYEADVTVWAGSATAARQLAPRLAKKLDLRIRRALAGKLHAKPVKLPPKQQPGPTRGGPDISRLALKTSDMSGATPSSATTTGSAARSPRSPSPSSSSTSSPRASSMRSARRSSGSRRRTRRASRPTSKPRSSLGTSTRSI